jgi:hypothetical protein
MKKKKMVKMVKVRPHKKVGKEVKGAESVILDEWLVAHHAGRVMAAGGRTRASDRERGYVGGPSPWGRGCG